MGHSHTHGDRAELDNVQLNPFARIGLLAVLAAALALTVVGLVRLWPDGEVQSADASAAFAAPGVDFVKAEVRSVQPACSVDQAGRGLPDCGHVTIAVDGGTHQIQVAPEVSSSGLARGDTLTVMHNPEGAQTADGQDASYSFFSVDRNLPLGLLAALFVVAVAVVARWRGVLALVGLGFGGLVLVKFMLPGLLLGYSGLAVAAIGSSAIMFVVLFLAHGFTMRTSAALAGTLAGIAVTAGLGLLVIDQARLTGVADEGAATLSTFAPNLNFQGLLTCAVIVAGLGVLNDVTITQASAVWELRAASPRMSRTQLYSSAMRIGRDHIASTIYTIVFAYAGAALSVLLLLYFYDRPLLELLNTEEIAEEVARTLASAIGLVLAVPITTGIATLTVGGRAGRRARLGD